MRLFTLWIGTLIFGIFFLSSVYYLILQMNDRIFDITTLYAYLTATASGWFINYLWKN